MGEMVCCFDCGQEIPRDDAWQPIDDDGTIRNPATPDCAAYCSQCFQDDQIAGVCHEANRAICEASGDHSQVAWPLVSQDIRASAMAGVRYAIEHPDATPEMQHAAWCEERRKAGWTYGTTKDAAAKTHPCLVPYVELPAEQRVKDHVFRAIVAALTPGRDLGA